MSLSPWQLFVSLSLSLVLVCNSSFSESQSPVWDLPKVSPGRPSGGATEQWGSEEGELPSSWGEGLRGQAGVESVSIPTL